MKNTPKKMSLGAGNNVNKLGARGGIIAGKVNFPMGTKQKNYPVKNSRPSPVRGQKKSVALYHSTRGRG